MITLGIETSCDETSAAIVKDGNRILSNVVASSLKFHKKYGGVIPEIASRLQLETISEVTSASIEESGIKPKEIGLISVTSGPGLLGSLLVGISFAKALSLSWRIPLLGVNHVFSHFYANFLNKNDITLPFVALVVSGGHTSLFYVTDFDKIKLLGSTQDDACGEAFDKVAKILNLGYPGGPLIEKLALRGNPKKLRFSSLGPKENLNFSFSGIKTAVLYYTHNKHIGISQKRDISAAFQEAVTDAIIRKTLSACKVKRAKSLLLGGGVIANSYLRNKFLEASKYSGIRCYFPPKELCMDNAAMVAGFGYQLYKKGRRSDLFLNLNLD